MATSGVHIVKRILILAATVLLTTTAASANPPPTGTSTIVYRVMAAAYAAGHDVVEAQSATLDLPRGRLPLPSTIALVALGLLGVLRLRP